MRVKFVAVCLVSLFFGCKATQAQRTDTIETRWKPYISLNNYSNPFWKSDVIYDETVQAIRENGKITAKLLFKAGEILSVKVANYSKTFQHGKDWNLKNGQLIILPGSDIPVVNKEDLVFTTKKPDFSMTGKVPGTFVLFTEKPFFSGLQISVTYKKAKSEKWRGPVPVFSSARLPGTINKLKGRKNLKLVFYGNSIEAGNNSSDHMKTAPFMPTWPELIVYNLRRRYGQQVAYSNQSVSGKLSGWGLEQVDARVVPEKPDLLIIGFGMNDGAGKISPDTFRRNIEDIMQHVLKQNPAAEFILIAPMLPNPDAIQEGIQASYKPELDKLAKTGVVVADMTAIHSELLRHKTYQDMTGNNVNHPNDYLARWYAQLILGYLIP